MDKATFTVGEGKAARKFPVSPCGGRGGGIQGGVARLTLAALQ